MNNPIEINPDLLGGEPVFTGTRVPVRNLLDYLENNQTIAEFREDYPTVGLAQIMDYLAGTQAGAWDRANNKRG